MNQIDFAIALNIGAGVIGVLVLVFIIFMGLRCFFLPIQKDNYRSPSIRDNVRRVK